jgi:iron complex outermembrane recepter protein
MNKLALLFCLVSNVMGQTSQPPVSNQAPSTARPAVKQEIVVTGTFEPVPMEETEREVLVDEVGQSPITFRNWADVLGNDSSIDLRQRVPGGSADLSIRGSSFGQTLVLVNGLRINDAQTGHNNLDLPFPFESVERMEVLEGSGSVFYGSDAVGGVVNFLTRVPEASELRFGFAGGNHGLNAQNTSAALLWHALGEQLTLTRELSTGFMHDRDYRNLALASESTVRSRLGRSDLMLGYSDRPFGAAQFYGPYPSWERTKGWLIAGSQDLGKNTHLAFGMRRHTDLFVLFRDAPAIYKNSHLEDSYELVFRRADSIHRAMRVLYGAEIDRDTIASNNLGNHQRNRGALYAALMARVRQRFSLSAGVREEWQSCSHHDFSPSIAASYGLGSGWKLKASASHAFRLPSFTDLYYSDPANQGNPNLVPENAWDYEGGLEARLASRVTTEVSVFHRRDRNVIDYARASAVAKWQARNIQSLNFTGVDGRARVEIGSQRVDVSYTWLHGSQQTLFEPSKYAFNYPSQAATVGWSGRLPKRLEARARVGVLERYQKDAYPLAELQLAKVEKHWKPYIQLSNATNTGYEEIPGVRMPGREVLVGIEFTIGRKD